MTMQIKPTLLAFAVGSMLTGADIDMSQMMVHKQATSSQGHTMVSVGYFGEEFSVKVSQDPTIEDGPSADDDIRAGRYKSFSNVEDMLRSLKNPY